jgi:hypothetical protein
MSAEMIDVEQNTDQWLQWRLGLPTCSMFKTVMAKGKGGGDSVTRKKYMWKLAAEIITGKPIPELSFQGNEHTERGHELEPEARDAYAFLMDADPIKAGFIRNEIAGGSPDSLLGNDGLLEIKTKLPHLHLECLENDRIPPEHIAQVQGLLWVSGREWVDLVSYWPGLRLFVKRTHRDEAYIARIKVDVQDFVAELNALVEKIR